MTICIAAVCDENTDDAKIVLCVDRKASSSLGSPETMMKTRIIGDNWRCLMSGADSDMLAANFMLRDSFLSQKAIDETNVVEIVRTTLNKRKRDKANEVTQGRYAISYDEFLATGKARLPEDSFRATITEIELLQLDAEFIIVGYVLGFPILVKTNNQGRVIIKEDFAVVGEGGYLAQATLLSREHQSIESLERTLYAVYEAKRASEGAPSVGFHTTIIIMHKNKAADVVTGRGMQFLKKQYNILGPKKIPSDLKLAPEFCEPLSGTGFVAAQ